MRWFFLSIETTLEWSGGFEPLTSWVRVKRSCQLSAVEVLVHEWIYSRILRTQELLTCAVNEVKRNHLDEEQTNGSWRLELIIWRILKIKGQNDYSKKDRHQTVQSWSHTCWILFITIPLTKEQEKEAENSLPYFSEPKQWTKGRSWDKPDLSLTIHG